MFFRKKSHFSPDEVHYFIFRYKYLLRQASPLCFYDTGLEPVINIGYLYLMKRNKPAKEITRKLTPKQALLHWIGFFIGAGIVIFFTAYGFFISLKPPFMLNSAPEETLGLV